jgi:subfamily B ATP-binding cassette protein MsbA
MEELKRLISFGRGHRRRFLAGTLCGVLAALITLVTAPLAGIVQKDILNAPAMAARGELGHRILQYALYLPGAALLLAMLAYASRYLMASASQGILAELRAALYASLVERPLSWLGRRHVAEFSSRVTNDVQRLDVGLSLRLNELIVNAPQVPVLLLLLFWYNWPLAILVTVVVPFTYLVVRHWSRRIKRSSRHAQEHVASLTSVLNETLGGIRIVKAYLAEGREIERFRGVNETLRRTNMRIARTMALSGPVLDVVSGCLLALLVGIALWQVSAGHLTSAKFISFFTAMTMLYRSTKKATSCWTELQNTAASAGRCFELLDDTESEPTGRKQVGPPGERIEFRDITFSYGELPALRGFNLVMRPGEVVALVGESGSGKTTVTNLLCRFYDVTAGAITWDGIDLREISPRSLRQNIALVTQDTVLFDDSVMRNIAYGDASPDPERVRACAQAAHAEEFIRELEHGYETRLGERGQRLSGGQKQRLAIARALYKNAPVLILDEATSALDSQSEALVQEALSRLMKGRTVLVVAHRLGTVKSADRIVVLSAGRVVQQGTHEALLAQEGPYRVLAELQKSA